MAELRLIDANALLKRIAHHTVHDSLKRITFEAANTYEQVKGDMFSLVQKAPIIEVAKVVVHARWKYNPPTATLVSSYNCTACGFCAFDHRVNECKYCPHCGAKMDGGAANG